MKVILSVVLAFCAALAGAAEPQGKIDFNVRDYGGSVAKAAEAAAQAGGGRPGRGWQPLGRTRQRGWTRPDFRYHWCRNLLRRRRWRRREQHLVRLSRAPWRSRHRYHPRQAAGRFCHLRSIGSLECPCGLWIRANSYRSRGWQISEYVVSFHIYFFCPLGEAA